MTLSVVTLVVTWFSRLLLLLPPFKGKRKKRKRENKADSAAEGEGGGFFLFFFFSLVRSFRNGVFPLLQHARARTQTTKVAFQHGSYSELKYFCASIKRILPFYFLINLISVHM